MGSEMCIRDRYDRHSSSEARPISSSTRIKFLYGHILEDLLILLSRASGHTVTEEQKQVDVEGIKGHQDVFTLLVIFSIIGLAASLRFAKITRK